MSAPLYILGSGGYARELYAYARLLDPARPIFYVDDFDQTGRSLTGSAYHAQIECSGGESIMGAGRCEIRRRQAAEIRPPFATLIHPSAVVLGEVSAGCVIAPGAVIAPNAILHPHVLVNYNATVGHDTIIEQYSAIGPTAAISGLCYLEEAVYIGAGAVIREQLRIGHDTIIGMGAVVTKDIEPNKLAMGVPARSFDKSQSGKRWLK